MTGRKPRLALGLLVVVIVLAALLLAGCDQAPAGVSPGGILTVDYTAGGDISALQVVVAYDSDEIVGNGNEVTFAFPLAAYDDGSSNIHRIITFECPGVPAGDYFVYAWFDYDGDGDFEPLNPDNEVYWLFGDGIPYSMNTVSPPYQIESSSGPALPTYAVTSLFAAPLDISLSFGGA